MSNDPLHALAAIPGKYAQPAADTLAKLPKPFKRDAEKGNCNVCGGYHGLPEATHAAEIVANGRAFHWDLAVACGSRSRSTEEPQRPASRKSARAAYSWPIATWLTTVLLGMK